MTKNAFPTTSRLWFATIIGLLLIGASLASGSLQYLKRVGWLEPAAYAEYMAYFCPAQAVGEGYWSGRCFCYRQPESDLATNVAPVVPDRDYIYAVGYGTLLTKLCKDLFFAGFIVLSCYLIASKRAPWPSGRALLLPLVFLANIGVGFMVSLYLWPSLVALAGLRSFAFVAVALVGGWARTGMDVIAKCVAVLIVLELGLAFIELLFGIPLRECSSSFRTAGTFSLPNSLGVFAVVGLAFYYSYSAEARYFWALVAAVACTVYLSGSGTGMLVLFCFLAFLALRKVPGPRKWQIAGALAVLGALLLAVLPMLTVRPDIYNSIFASTGRVSKLTEAISDFGTLEILFGRGIGVGTNAANDFFNAGWHILGLENVEMEGYAADSMVTVLMIQLGIVGVLLFYGLLLWAFLRDRQARSVYLVFALTSLTLNINELFPVNFLLGLALASTLSLSQKDYRTAEHA